VSDALIASDLAPGLHVAPGVEIPPDAEIAPFVTVYAGVRLGAGVTLEQGAIVGRPQRVAAQSRAPRRPAREPTLIGDGCWIGNNAIVVAGARVGARVYVGDQALVRELATVADDVVVGRSVSVGHNAVVGARTRLFNFVLVGPGTVIEEDVLAAPRVTFVSDTTMGRGNGDAPPGGVVVRRASRIGTAAIIMPPTEIGAEAVIGAASLVRGDVAARTVVAGAPARVVRTVREDELLEWP
jgi:UDP-2-acetamido-3-amino-2,3-dideoxy-glucuronate N-acetyltransferase